MATFSMASAHPSPDWLKGLFLPAFLIAVWWSLTTLNLVNQNFIVSPKAVIDAAVLMHEDGILWPNLQASLVRLALGGLVGSVAGISFGLLLSFSKIVDRLTSPAFGAFKQISVFAWIPLISLTFGLGEPAKIFFIALVAFFPAVVNTYEGIKSVPKGFIEVGKVYQFSLWLSIRRILLPAAAPSILMGVELAAIYAWLGTIGSEYLLSGTGGIGAMMSSAQQLFMMDQIFVGIFISGGIGFLLTALMHSLRTRILHWQKKP
jgi:sulfonate transport system permease protein